MHLLTLFFVVAAAVFVAADLREQSIKQLIHTLFSPNNTTANPQTHTTKPQAELGFFLRDLDIPAINNFVEYQGQFDKRLLQLVGFHNIRVLPGNFPSEIEYHFDGLASVLRFSFTETGINITARMFESEAATNWDKCLFLGSGSGPTLGRELCFQNPGVNILPIGGQLWLTIDTYAWGRIDPDSLETVSATTAVDSVTLNAHPACDPNTNECFVQHPCPLTSPKFPIASDVCVSRLRPTKVDIEVDQLGRAELPNKRLIQHSHSPGVTENFVVAKIDCFEKRSLRGERGGLLRVVRQQANNDWLLFDRRTNQTRLLQSNIHFVNNHFWNVFENDDGDLVVDTVAATDQYLDTYFAVNLTTTPEWETMFMPPHRCIVPTATNETNVTCSPLFPSATTTVFDYPTFNPLFKMNKSFRWFYAIAASHVTSNTSKFFDKVIKVDSKARKIIAEWSEENIFVTEADFVPTATTTTETAEDDGLLVSVGYNATADRSSVFVFDAKDLSLVEQLPLPVVVPFHAHGIVCTSEGHCHSNP